MPDTPRLRPVPDLPLTGEEEAELEASMRRHPAGRARNINQCPTCGQNASGALGELQPTL